jgi:uncharacterized repeat protein (TIGR01451 family)
MYYNSAVTNNSNYMAWIPGLPFSRSTVEYTCTTPDPGGAGNITNDPQFVDASVSNFHLLPTSPCIDAGTNQAWMIGAVDLDGHPRVVNETVDMGAYEGPKADLKIAKTGPAYAFPGTSVIYTITVTNLWPATASNVWVTDELPAGVTPASMAPTYVGHLVAGSATSITLMVTVDSNTLGWIVNAANVTSDEPDAQGSNNTSEVATLVVEPHQDQDADGLTNAEEIGYGTDLFDSDTDRDGMPDGDEVFAGTDPTNGQSYVVGITSVTPLPGIDGFVIKWSSVSNTYYAIYCTPNLTHGFDLPLQNHISATPPLNKYTDTVGGNAIRCYRVEVEP